MMILEDTRISPFAYCAAERLNAIHPRGDAAYLHLSALDKRILALLNLTLITTPDLLSRQLQQLGWEENIQNQTLRHTLDRLFRCKYLMRFEFVTPECRSFIRVYALAQNGKEYIRSIGREVNHSKLVSKLDAVGAKKLLSAAQYLTYAKHIADAKEIHIGKLVTEVVKPGYHTDYRFRPQSIVQRSDDRTIFVEVIRSEPQALNLLCDELRRIGNKQKPGPFSDGFARTGKTCHLLI